MPGGTSLRLVTPQLVHCHSAVVPGVEVVLEAAGRQSAAPGAQGEILVRGPGVMKGYLNLPEATARTLAGGWLRTGDIGRFDAAGRLDILGRADDKILRGEEHIYPAEVTPTWARRQRPSWCCVTAVRWTAAIISAGLPGNCRTASAPASSSSMPPCR